MKTKFLFLTALILFLGLAGQTPNARADDDDALIVGGCQTQVAGTTSALLYMAAFDPGGQTCRNLVALDDGVQILKASLLPMAVMAMRNPEIASSLSAEAVAAGLTLANPVVLTVAIMGAGGLGTAAYLINAETEECRQGAMQARIQHAIEAKLQRSFPQIDFSAIQ